MPKIYLYAEVLTHIRQLTLHATLQSEKNESPEIQISSDKKVITVKHDGETSSLYLPTQISGTADVTFETDKKTELNARVQIDDLEQWKKVETAGIEAPWNASDLTLESTFKCQQCDAEILPSNHIASWKDLPNQDWADVMDLWYCHKPLEDHDTEEQKQAAEAKGTSSTSKLASKQGVGMIDLTSFVLNPGDCTGIQISDRDNKNDFKARTAKCSKCITVLGSYSPIENLARLYKSRLSVRKTREELFISYSPSTFIAAQILALIESTPIRKIVVHSTSSSEDRNRSNLVASDTKSSSSNLESGIKPIEGTKPIQEVETAQPELSSNSPPLSQTPNLNPMEEILFPSPGLLLWIFNPNIYYSSSLHPQANFESQPSSSPSSPSALSSSSSTPSPPIATPHRALKIFYKPILNPQTHLSNTTEELNLPTQSDVTSLQSALKRSTTWLPIGARKFQDWNVGVLDRWERTGTAEEVLGENPLARKKKMDGSKADGGTGVKMSWELPEGWRELYR